MAARSDRTREEIGQIDQDAIESINRLANMLQNPSTPVSGTRTANNLTESSTPSHSRNAVDELRQRFPTLGNGTPTAVVVHELVR